MRAFPNLLAGLAALALADNAPLATNQDSNVRYITTLPSTSPVTGSVVVAGAAGGQGVQVYVTIAGLPNEGGPFLYHIHNQSLAANGSCATAGGHLDPYQNGGTGCNASDPAACEVGDLSGKHGTMSGPGAFSASYLDFYVSVDDGPATVKGHSLVMHFANKTAITCANFTLNGAASGAGGTVVPQSSGANSPGSPSGTPATGPAAPNTVFQTVTVNGGRGQASSPTNPSAAIFFSATTTILSSIVVGGAGTDASSPLNQSPSAAISFPPAQGGQTSPASVATVTITKSISGLGSPSNAAAVPVAASIPIAGPYSLMGQTVTVFQTISGSAAPLNSPTAAISNSTSALGPISTVTTAKSIQAVSSPVQIGATTLVVTAPIFGQPAPTTQTTTVLQTVNGSAVPATTEVVNATAVVSNATTMTIVGTLIPASVPAVKTTTTANNSSSISATTVTQNQTVSGTPSTQSASGPTLTVTVSASQANGTSSSPSTYTSYAATTTVVGNSLFAQPVNAGPTLTVTVPPGSTNSTNVSPSISYLATSTVIASASPLLSAGTSLTSTITLPTVIASASPLLSVGTSLTSTITLPTTGASIIVIAPGMSTSYATTSTVTAKPSPAGLVTITIAPTAPGIVVVRPSKSSRGTIATSKAATRTTLVTSKKGQKTKHVTGVMTLDALSTDVETGLKGQGGSH